MDRERPTLAGGEVSEADRAHRRADEPFHGVPDLRERPADNVLAAFTDHDFDEAVRRGPIHDSHPNDFEGAVWKVDPCPQRQQRPPADHTGDPP